MSDDDKTPEEGRGFSIQFEISDSVIKWLLVLGAICFVAWVKA